MNTIEQLKDFVIHDLVETQVYLTNFNPYMLDSTEDESLVYMIRQTKDAINEVHEATSIGQILTSIRPVGWSGVVNRFEEFHKGMYK